MTSAYCTFSMSIGSTSLAFCSSVIGFYGCLLKTLALDNVPTLSSASPGTLSSYRLLLYVPAWWRFALAVENLHNSLQGKPCEGTGILQAQELGA